MPTRTGQQQSTSFATARRFIVLYGVLGAVVLGAVIVRAVTGHVVPGFLWGRSGAVLATSFVAYWLLLAAGRGARWAYLRIRIISVVMPIAIIGVDLVPGLCPWWFAAMQAVCALAIVPVAFIVNSARMRAAFAA